MNFLADYASDDEENNLEVVPVKTTVAPIVKAPPSSSSSLSASSSSSSISMGKNVENTKKKQAIIFSALPIEIQNALTHGSTTLDSDSEEETDAITSKAPVTAPPVAHAGKRKQQGNGLMSLLPAPKNTLPVPATIAVAPRSTSTLATAAIAASGTETRPFKVAKLQAGETTVRSTKPAPVASVDDQDKDDDDDDDALVLGGGVDIISQIRSNAAAQSSNMFSFVSTSPTGNASSSASSRATESAFDDEPPEILHLKPQLSAFGGVANPHAYAQSSSSSSSSGSSSSGNGSDSRSAQYMQQQSHPRQQQHSEYAQHSTQACAGEESYPYAGTYGSYEGGNEGGNGGGFEGGFEGDFEGTQGISRAERRRRDRDIEQHLINGDLDAATGQAPSLINVRAAPQWNAHAYNAQRQQEAEIARSFGRPLNPGESLAGVAMPSKTASRKHQITSLVAQAAKTEILMLDTKGHRNKSKAETAGKYGW